MGAWIEELRRRGVLRTAALYAAGAWILVQIATQVFPFFDIPNWAVRRVVVAAVCGAPFVLVLSWFYEWTPAGLRPEPAADGSARADVPRRPLRLALLAAAALALTVLSASLLVARAPQAPPPAKGPSIAVLPFRSLSAEADTAYFAEGVQDEILTRLAKIGTVRVVSRTSTARYASAPSTLKDIARELDVDHVLEGSVQRRADEARVSVQLIEAPRDRNIWSETYDRALTDVFGVESAIAHSIVEALRLKLTGAERAAIEARPTRNPEAYERYLRGLAFSLRSFKPVNLRQAESLLREAVSLDPDFALAWSRLARVDAALGYQLADAGQSGCERARGAAETALGLQPQLAEALIAQGNYLYLCKGDLPAAKATLEAAQARLPGSAETLETLGSIEHRLGNWDAAIARFQAALALDPRNTRLLGTLALTLLQMRRFEEARGFSTRAWDIDPGDLSKLALGIVADQAEGRLSEAHRRLQDADDRSANVEVFDYQILQLLYEGEYKIAAAMLERALAADVHSIGAGAGDYFYLLGVAQRALGDAAAAKRSFESGAEFLGRYRNADAAPETQLYVRSLLCLMDAGRGVRNGRSEEGSDCRATRAAAEGPGPYAASAREALARAAALRGDTEAALAPLASLLDARYYSFLYTAPLTPALLRQDPLWAPLRRDPRFPRLSAAPAANPSAAVAP